MHKDDLFIKISIDAYFPLEGKNVKQEKTDEANLYYIDGELVDPSINLYESKENDIEFDSESCGIDIVSREKIWEEDPNQKIFDEILAKHQEKDKE